MPYIHINKYGLGAKGSELGPQVGRVPTLALEHLNLDQDANSLFAETQDTIANLIII